MLVRNVLYKMLRVFVLTYVLAISVEGDAGSERLVNTAQGPVSGAKDPQYGVYAFYGIPYATAPNGVNRFKSPLPPPIWLDTFEAKEDKRIVCPQVTYVKSLPPNTTQHEDCLIANVFAPESEEKNLPVVVYVHGGAFQLGFGNFYTPKGLVESKKVIAVTFNYRLGAHGFLCLGTNDAPGNAGMKDQVALLRWVKKNIANFGGNPHDVTIAGYSAGSSSVDLLMLSEMAKGLFTKVIAESGANIAASAIQRDPIANAKEYAKALGFDYVDDIYALEHFYKTVSFETLASVDVLNNMDSTFTFVPCIERDVGQEKFLDADPVNIIKTGKYQKVPMLYGFANMEGLFRFMQFNIWKDKMNQDLSLVFPADLEFPNIDEKKKVIESVRQLYFKGQPVDEDNVLGYIDYFSDIIFAYPMLRAVKLHAEAGNHDIYLYEYSFVDDNTPLIPNTNIRGATHCAQTSAVLDEMIPGKRITEEFKKMKATMRQIWINFITTGKPVPDGSTHPRWPPADLNRNPHMSLNKSLELKGPLLQQRAHFWDEIYKLYYKPASPPHLPMANHSEL